MSISKKDLEVLVKEFPSVERRNPDWWDNPQLPIELDSNVIDKNKEAAIWLLENSDIILEIINQYVGLRQYINDPVVANEFPIIGEGCWIRPKHNNDCGWEKC